MKRIYNVPRWCMGCGLCEVACVAAHSRSGDVVKAYKMESPRPLSRVRVEGDASFSMAVQCRHCDEPKCVAACITGAMRKDPATGVVSVDESRCVGCLTCVAACPFGCVMPGKKAVKCDMCESRTSGADGACACVEACPNRALVLVDVGEGGDDGGAGGAGVGLVPTRKEPGEDGDAGAGLVPTRDNGGLTACVPFDAGVGLVPTCDNGGLTACVPFDAGVGLVPTRDNGGLTACVPFEQVERLRMEGPVPTRKEGRKEAIRRA